MEVSPLFEPLFSDKIDDPRYEQVFGGRGSGKSFAVALAKVDKTYSRKYRHKILYLRQTMSSSEDSTISDIELVLTLTNRRDDFSFANNKYTNKITGNTIVFKGIQASGSQTAKLKSLSGITDVVIEEAEEIKSFDEFSKIDEGVRVKGIPLKLTLIYNPGSAISSWIHKEWFVDGKPNPERLHDTIFIHSTYLDNLKNLAKSTIRRYRDLEKTNPTYYKHTILAEWTLEASNRVYEGWGEYPCFYDNGTVWYGLDFGYGGTDSTALIRINLFDDVYYIEEVFSVAKQSISDTIQSMKDHGISPHVKIIADSAVPTLITEIRKAGYGNIRGAKKGPNSKDQGIKKVQDMPIVMVGDNPHLSFAYLTWKRNDKGVLPHEPDTLAALRYGLTYTEASVKGGSKVVKTHGYT